MARRPASMCSSIGSTVRLAGRPIVVPPERRPHDRHRLHVVTRLHGVSAMCNVACTRRLRGVTRASARSRKAVQRAPCTRRRTRPSTAGPRSSRRKADRIRYQCRESSQERRSRTWPRPGESSMSSCLGRLIGHRHTARCASCRSATRSLPPNSSMRCAGAGNPHSGRRRAAPQVTLTERERHVLGGVADGLRCRRYGDVDVHHPQVGREPQAADLRQAQSAFIGPCSRGFS